MTMDSVYPATGSVMDSLTVETVVMNILDVVGTPMHTDFLYSVTSLRAPLK